MDDEDFNDAKDNTIEKMNLNENNVQEATMGDSKFLDEEGVFEYDNENLCSLVIEKNWTCFGTYVWNLC